MFYIFMNIHINYSKVINRMASTTFAILLIHDSNYFRNLIWNYILRSPIGEAILQPFGYLIPHMNKKTGGTEDRWRVRTPFTTYRKEHAHAANDKPQTPGRTGSAGRFSL